MSRQRKAEISDSVQSVQRALSLLEILAKEPNLSISKIAERSGLKITTAHRLASTLMQRGYIEQDPETLHYRLGIKTFEIGNASLLASDLREVVQPYLRKLRDTVNETVNLAVLDGVEVVYIDQMESQNIVIVKMFARVGSRGPAYCTATGKLLLSDLPEEEIKKRFASIDFIRFTEYTTTDCRQLIETLGRIKKDGYALDFSERDLGVTCIAAPIRNSSGRIQAAISVSGPENRMTTERINMAILPELLDAARMVSEKFGFLTPMNLSTLLRQ
jgi:DNA-binding IclR family transcriptional regulator